MRTFIIIWLSMLALIGLCKLSRKGDVWYTTPEKVQELQMLNNFIYTLELPFKLITIGFMLYLLIGGIV